MSVPLAAAADLPWRRRAIWAATAGVIVLLLCTGLWLRWSERRSLLDEASALSERRVERLADDLAQALAVAKVAIALAEAQSQGRPGADAMATDLGRDAPQQMALLKSLPLPFEVHALGAGGRLAERSDAAPAPPRSPARPLAAPVPPAGRWRAELAEDGAGPRALALIRSAAPNGHGIVAYAARFDHATLLARLEKWRMRQGGSAALFRIEPDGGTTVLARAPHDESELGMRVLGPLAQALAHSPSGVFRAQTALDSAHRTVAYHRLAGDADTLVVAYAMATDAVLAGWTAQRPPAVLAMLLLCMGLLWGGWRLDLAVRTEASTRQALRRSDSQFRTLADNLPDVVVRLDAQGRHLYANAAIEGAIGLAPGAVVGKTVAQLGLAPEHAAALEAALQRALAGEPTQRLEFSYPGPSGLRNWEVLVVPERPPAGAQPTALVIGRDITERLQGLESLRESEARHRRLFEAHPTPMWLYDLETLEFLDVNAAAVAHYGYSREEFLRMMIKDIRPPEEVPRMLASVALGIDGPQNPGIWRHTVRGGRQIDVQITSHAQSFKGRAAKLVQARDVTEQMRAESTLREREERLRLAMQAANQGMYDLDLRTGKAVVSAEYARMLGYEPEELEESNVAWRERLHPDDRDLVERAFEDYIAGRLSEYRLEFRQRTKDGHWKWILSVGKVQARGAQGEPLRMLGTHTDISAAREAQAALRASEARLAYLLRSTATVIYTANTRVDCDATYYSPNLPALLGWQPEQFVRDPGFWLDHVHPDDRDAVLAQMDTLPQKGEVVLEYRFLHKDGRWRWMRDALRQARDAAGNPTEQVGSWIDITAHREAEDEVRRLAVELEQRVQERTAQLEQAMQRAENASRAKSLFLSHMSHELRTPLNAILGFAQIIEMSSPSPAQLEWAGHIRRAGAHLLQMIGDLLDLARIEVGKVSIQVEPVALAPVLGEALAIVQPLIEERRLHLVQHCPALATPVKADRLRLRQVLVNLLSNAAKYNRDGGTVTVRCERQGDRLRLSVADTGNGIAPEQLELLFRPFERLGAEMGKIEGTGIGLALSSQLAKLMGAELGVRSEVGVGSEFWVDLATLAADTPAAGKPAATAAAGAEADLDLLYVEDNPSNIELVAALLDRHAGSRLRTAGDGPAGLAMARDKRPACILLDIHLPGMDGYEILRRLRADPGLRDIPVVALSADAMAQDIERGLAAGFDRYLAKPVDLNELLQTLQELRPARCT